MMNSAGMERKKRISEAISLKVPDRVPIFLKPNYFGAKYGSMTYKDAYYKQDEWLEANKKFIYDYEPDMFSLIDSAIVTPGPVHDILGTLQMKWPGNGIGIDTGHQFVEAEYMKQEEYDHFIDDPSDYLVRVLTPRYFKNLEGLSNLPSLKTLVAGSFSAGFMVSAFTDQKLLSALESIVMASKHGSEWDNKFSQFHKDMEEEGFSPSHALPVVVMPFDIISSYLRGMRGTMIDMFKVPEKLLAAQDKLFTSALNSVNNIARFNPGSRVFIPLHRGADGFMSNKQFEIFYWPQLKEILLYIIDKGLTPMPFFEGKYDQRLEYLADLPKGKILGLFDNSDMKKVKSVLKDTMCIAGGMPCSLLQTGTPESVRKFTKELIDFLGKDGGYIMCSNTVLDEVDPELLRVWVEFTKEYGTYR